MFVGVDVFHAPMVYDAKAKERKRKASCAAIIVQVYRETGVGSNKEIELFTKTYRREGGVEYNLKEPLKETIGHAMKVLKVDPKSVIMWRDGIGDTAFDTKAAEEIKGIREGLAQHTVGSGGKNNTQDTPLAYIVCQKRIATKFLVAHENQIYGAPSGTMVSAIQGLQYQTFYINGRAPPFSTAKPVRFIIVQRDEGLMNAPMSRLTWNQCHDYPNWTGPVKVPSVCQMAHKLAELAGQMQDCGESINADKYKNKVYFL